MMRQTFFLLSLYFVSCRAFVITPSLFVKPASSSSSVLRSKNSDRAHIERSLEDMMDNDWRVFRAKLVAQERAAAEQQRQKQQNRDDKDGGKSPSGKNGGNSGGKNKKPEDGGHDRQLAKQGQLGEMFAGAISSIFKSNHSGSQGNGNRKSSSSSDIFDGKSVGGLSMLSDDMDDLPDPFATEAELPLYLSSNRDSTVTVDKHRWAHEIPHVERGCVLIANEKLGGVFHQTVVLVIDHHDSTGSTGVVINRCV